MPNRDITTEIWIDPWFQALTPLQRYLFLYTWTNDHCNPAALYKISMATLCFETTLTPEQIRNMMPLLAPKVYFDESAGLMWVRNFVRIQKRGQSFIPAVLRCLWKTRPHRFLTMFAEEYADFEGLAHLSKEFANLAQLSPSWDQVGTNLGPSSGAGAGVLSSFEVKGGAGEEGGLPRDFSVEAVPLFLEPLPVGEKPSPTRKKKRKPKEQTNPDHKLVIDFYFKQFQEYRHVDPYITGKDVGIVTRLIAHIELAEIKALLVRFFESEDKFILNSGYTLGVFESQITKLRLNEQGSQVLGGEKLWLAMGETKDGKTEGRKEICTGDGKDPAGATNARIEDFN
jgi:hypothetical protein